MKLKRLALMVALFLMLSSCGKTSDGNNSTNQPQQDQSQASSSSSATVQPSDTSDTKNIEIRSLPRPLTVENSKDFIDIIDSSGEKEHSTPYYLDWIYYDGVLVLKCDGVLTYNPKETPWEEYTDEITEIILADGCTQIDEDAIKFACMPNVESIILPETLTNMPIMTICPELKYISIPNKIKVIPEKCLWFTKIEQITLPEGLETIEEEAFRHCINLKSINLPSTLTAIEQEAFLDCTSLAGDIVIPSGVIRLEDGVFENCENISSITLPEGLTTIRNRALYNCKNLTEVIIPDSVTFLSDKAFGECIGITSINIPVNMKQISGNPFYKCTNLESITSDSKWFFVENDILIHEDGLFDHKMVDGEFVGTYKRYIICGLSKFQGDLDLSSQYQGIESSAFAGCTGLKSVKTAYVYEIEESTFEDCTGLEYVELVHHPVNMIGERAFAGCTSLKNVTFITDVAAIEKEAFEGCTSLETVNAEEINQIHTRAFAGCTSLAEFNTTTIYIGVADDAFEGCINLKEEKLK